GPSSNPTGTEHLFKYLLARVGQLRTDASEQKPRNTEFTGYLCTIAHCEAVLNNRAPSEARGPRGFENRSQYFNGIYLFQEVAHSD
ncbi:hypothetical protein, partial [Thauera butanivorans]|uniref:hypothetical protein n=1 Tax=Thauera butanivorans TaxID=86174 RepID=UPI000B02A4EC